MDRTEPAEVKQARNALRMSPLRLDRHGLQGTFHLARFHQDDGQTRKCEPPVQPLR